MTVTTKDLQDQILRWIEADRDKLVQFLADFTAIPTPNPPGDTVRAAEFIRATLAAEGVSAEIRAAKPHLPNVLASLDGGAPGRHLVLNGHIDVFPAGDPDRWTRDPWSGAIADGKVHGRGAVDMKCGTTASIWTQIYLSRVKEHLKGKLTLTCVSDEETGGTWGAKWLLDTYPDEVRGDCMLNGEPSMPSMIRIGEKGTLRAVFEVSTKGAHAAYTHMSENAIEIATRLIQDLYTIAGRRAASGVDFGGLLEKAAPVIDAGIGAGAAAILDKTTVSVGVINGGVKINVMPGECRFECDFRLPPGMTHAEMLGFIDAIMARYPAARMTPVWTHSCEPTHSPADHEMLAILQRTVTGLGWAEPVASVSLGATDCKHWRGAGTPSYVYGCNPRGMGQPDEWVDIEEFLHVVRTHVLASLQYLRA